MIVGVMRIELSIPEAQSLKDKRQVIKSLKDRIRNKYNVSVAEVEAQDRHKIGVLAVAMVSTETRALHSQLDQLVDLIRREPRATVLSYDREVL